MTAVRLPKKLKILPGKRWTGKITVISRSENGLILVEFDAEDPRAAESERHVYDRTVMTPAQLFSWTGEMVGL